MKNTLSTATAFLGTAALVRAVSNTASGRAVVINQCDYDVYIFNTPAAGEGGTEQDSGALAKGQSWSQQWTGLTSASGSHDGWSIKISKTNAVTNNILQYEYTYQPTINSDLVWLDLSSVDGVNNPWIADGWTLGSTQSCGSTLLQNISYTTPDDNAAMQPACPATADLTVTLCQWPGGAASSTQSAVASATSVSIPNPVSVLSSVLSSVLEPTPTSTTAAAPTTTSATTSATKTHGSAPHTIGFGNGEYAVNELNANNAAASSATPTTLATVVSSAEGVFFGHTVVEVETAFVTSYVTAEGAEPTAEVRKRHEHHAAHHHRA